MNDAQKILIRERKPEGKFYTLLDPKGVEFYIPVKEFEKDPEESVSLIEDFFTVKCVDDCDEDLLPVVGTDKAGELLVKYINPDEFYIEIHTPTNTANGLFFLKNAVEKIYNFKVWH